MRDNARGEHKLRVPCAIAIAVAASLSGTPIAVAETYQVEGAFAQGDPMSDPGDNGYGSYIDGYDFYAAAGELEFFIQGDTFLPGLMIQDAQGTVLYRELGSAIDRALGTRWTVPAAGNYSFFVFQSFPMEGNYTFTVTEIE